MLQKVCRTVPALSKLIAAFLSSAQWMLMALVVYQISRLLHCGGNEKKLAQIGKVVHITTTTLQCLVLVLSKKGCYLPPFALQKCVQVGKCATHWHSCTGGRVGNE